MASGGGGAGGASGTAASGSIVSLPAVTSLTVISNTGGSAYSSGFVASGSIGGSGGMSGTAASGSAPSPVTTPNAPRTDTGTRTGSQSPPLSTGPAPYASAGELPRTGEYSTTSSALVLSFPTTTLHFLSLRHSGLHPQVVDHPHTQRTQQSRSAPSPHQ
ncbi:hypothetical protein LTR27_002241 [Elasticomyces elasticus]|nr:hypothetical protein LTR27_002241 [Elasticomyces elasticus]